MISTKGRYSVRILLDLAEHENGSFIPMKEVAARQGISLKYLERILPELVSGHLVEGVHGKGGGYRLTKKPEDISVAEVLKLTEGDIAPVACLEDNAVVCDRMEDCRTLPLWKGLNDRINEYLESVKITDLMKK